MEHCPKYNYFLKRKKSASKGGGPWEFRFCGFGYFLDRFWVFIPEIFDIRCGFRFFLFDLFRFRFLSDLSGNYAPPLISNSS